MDELFYTEEEDKIKLWYSDGDHCADIRGNLGLGISARETGEFICKSIKKENRRIKFKKALETLTDCLIRFDKKMEKIMKLPSTYDRGRQIAEAMNDLTITNQSALHFELGYSFEKIKKLYSTD